MNRKEHLKLHLKGKFSLIDYIIAYCGYFRNKLTRNS